MAEKESTKTTAPEGDVRPLLIEREMRDSYLNYAMSVIHARALPDVRDGLKPSQRRILVAMNDLNLGPRSKHRKCAKIAGDTSGNYHPHGESVIYPTLVRMAQEFNMRYQLVDGQGNFGSIDGDPPAAMRYTEARMFGPAVDALADLDKDTVDFEPNYDETRMVPTILPGGFPNLICNGGSGIAVGMASSMAPHNLTEVCNALDALLDDPGIDVAGLMKHIPGPDFPTGAIVCGRRGIHDAYTTGRGLVTVRGRHTIEERRGRSLIVFTEIPYAQSKSRIVEKLADLVRGETITGVSDIRDESGRDGIRLVIVCKKDAEPEVLVRQIFRHTPLQSTFSIINLALQNGRPTTLTLKGILAAWRDHRREVIRRRTAFLLDKAERRLHILDGLKIALANIDMVIEIVKKAADVDSAKKELGETFELSGVQTQAIVDMRLGRLTGLERDKLEEERQGLITDIADYQDILEREERVTDMIREEVERLRDRYGDERRTELGEPVDNLEEEDLIEEEQVVVTVTQDGYVKRTPVADYRSQGRGGRGVKGTGTKEGDVVSHLFAASTHDYLMLFTDQGRVHWLKVFRLPAGSRTSRGRSLANLVELQEDEGAITQVLAVSGFDDRSVIFATEAGTVKKTALEAFSRPMRGGIRAIDLAPGDRVIGVGLCGEGDAIVLGTRAGKAIRFNQDQARAMGRVARGVRGIRLAEGDAVEGMVVAPTDGEGTLMTVCENGYGKRTLVADYRTQGRGGQGLIDIKATKRNGPVVAILACDEGDEVMYVTAGGMIVRTRVADVSTIGRNTQGVKLVDLKDGDTVVSVTLVTADEDEEDAVVASGEEEE